MPSGSAAQLRQPVERDAALGEHGEKRGGIRERFRVGEVDLLEETAGFLPSSWLSSLIASVITKIASSTNINLMSFLEIYI